MLGQNQIRLPTSSISGQTLAASSKAISLLRQIIEECDDFLRVKHHQAHICSPIAHNTKYIFLLRAADLGRDLTIDDLTVLEHSSMINYFRDFTREGVLQNATRSKYLALFKHKFCDFLLQTQRMDY